MDEQTKQAIDIILKTIQMEMRDIIYRNLIYAYELGQSSGAIEALEAVKKIEIKGVVSGEDIKLAYERAGERNVEKL